MNEFHPSLLDRLRAAQARGTCGGRGADHAPPPAGSGLAADLLADLSHEMRTPLNAVIGFSEAIAQESYGPLGHQKYGEYATIIRASGGHLLDLVNSILDLARIEAGRMTLKRERTDLRALAAECAAMMRLEAEKSGLALNVRVDDDVPECFVDPRAVRQILINLLSNAVKFTADGAIGLVLYRDQSDVVLAVADTGVGMSEEEIARLGRRFAATRGDGLRGAKSAGLGLALAMALADLHGGKMTLKSAPGEGLVATVRLPVGAPAAPRRRLKAVEGGLSARASGPPPEILTQLERIEAYRRGRASAA